jgi:hypothetical protein
MVVIVGQSGFWWHTPGHLYVSISHQGSPQICCHMTSSNSVRLEK